MFERFSSAARDSVLQAQVEARELRQQQIGSEHLLLGVLWQGDGPAIRSLAAGGIDYRTARRRLVALVGDEVDPEALALLGIDLADVRQRVERTFGEGALDGPGSLDRRRMARGHIPFSKGAKKSLELALREAINLRRREIEADHLLLGVFGDVGSLAHRLLESLSVDPIQVRNELRTRLRPSA